MKRKGNLYHQVCSMDNLILADKNARREKGKCKEIKRFDRNRGPLLQALHEMLVNKTYKTSPYRVYTLYEHKVREISQLPYYPDRIVQHADMNILKGIFIPMFTADSYSSIPGKGVHKAVRNMRKALKDTEHTTYCLKIDITKFYPNVDHDILKQLLRRKLKDNDFLEHLDEVIDSAPGLPIGNYLSQYFANLYLTGFDHWLKEVKRIKYYFRYADDLVILHEDKQYLHALLAEIQQYLAVNLKLTVKGNYQIFPVEARGIDVLGYVLYHTHIRIRKRIKQTCARRIKRNKNRAAIDSYKGWMKHGNCRHLQKKLFREKI